MKKFKRILVGLVSTVTMLTATVVPAFAAEEHSDSFTKLLMNLILL